MQKPLKSRSFDSFWLPQSEKALVESAEQEVLSQMQAVSAAC